MRHSAMGRAVVSWVGAALMGGLMAGCFSVNRPSLEKRYFVLDVERAAPALGNTIPVKLWIGWVRIAPEFQGREFVYRTGEYAYQPDFYNAFLIPPEKLIHDQLYRWLVDSGLERSAPAPARDSDTWTLYVSVSELYADLRKPSEPRAVIEAEVFVEAPTRRGGGIEFHRDYSREIPLQDNSVTTIVAGWNKALREILLALEADLRKVDWPSDEDKQS